MGEEECGGFSLYRVARLVPLIDIVEEGLDRAGKVGEIVGCAERNRVGARELIEGYASFVCVNQLNFRASLACTPAKVLRVNSTYAARSTSPRTPGCVTARIAVNAAA